jgi:hypothetical protein
MVGRIPGFRAAGTKDMLNELDEEPTYAVAIAARANARRVAKVAHDRRLYRHRQ